MNISKKIMFFVIAGMMVLGLALVACGSDGSSGGALAGKKVFMDDEYIGYAFSEAKIDSIVREFQERGLDSDFVKRITTGDELTDPDSGVTFLVEEGETTVELSNIAAVFILDDASLDELVNSSISVNQFEYVGPIETSFGTFDLYQ